MNLSCTSVIFISKTLTVHAGNSIVYLNIFAFIKFIEAFENASCNHIKNKNGLCSVFNAPFDVKLSDSPLTIVQPDIMVICDKNKLDGKRCNGAPDFIIVSVNFFEENILSVQYSFDAIIKVNIYDDLFINFTEVSSNLHMQYI